MYSPDTSYYPYQRLFGCCFGVLNYIRELNWSGKKLVELLESTGTLINSLFCIEQILDFSELYSLQYILSHVNNAIKEFRLGDQSRYSVYKVSGYGLEANFLEAMESCLNATDNNTIGFSSTL